MTKRRTLFCIITGFFWFSLYAYVPQLTRYAKEMGASYKMIGLIAGAYGLSQTIIRIPLGILSDSLNKRKIFITFGILTTIASAALIFIWPNVYTLLLGRFLAGVAAATWVNFTVMFSSYYKNSESTKAIGIINSANKVGQLLAMLIGGLISLYFGIRYIFLISVIGGIIALILNSTLDEEISTVVTTPFQTKQLIDIIKNKEILYICFLGIMSQLITFASVFGFTPLVALNLGADNFELGLLTMSFNFPQIIFVTLSGTIFVKYLGERMTLLIGFGICTFICILTPFIPSLFILYIVQVFNGIGNAISFTLLMGLVIKNIGSELRTTIMGFYQAVYGIGMIAGPILLGSIGDRFGLVIGFVVTGFLGMFAILSILLSGLNKDKSSGIEINN